MGRTPASQRAEYFFEQFYTVLIFADILVVLLALRHSFAYDLVLRNSGFAAATVLIRLSGFSLAANAARR